MNIEIYSKDNCPNCDMAIKKAINMYDTVVQIFKLGNDFDRDELLELFPSARTFPQIKIDGESIGGWQEFKEIK